MCYLQEAELYDDYDIPPLHQTQDAIYEDFKKGLILKAFQNEKVIGSVRAYAKDESCYIGRLIVHPEFQNRGLGKLLMAKVEAAYPNAKRFELFTGHASEKNLALYGKLGYRRFKQQEINEKLNLIFLEKMNP
ncbi:MAG: GNAT family N-acetyltransferase [Bacteroidota bacterium]